MVIFVFEGDCNNSIYLWEPTSAATWNIDKTPFTGHTGSVEDLQVCTNAQSKSCFSSGLEYIFCAVQSLTQVVFLCLYLY